MKNRQDNILSGVLMAKTLLGSAGVCLLFELLLRFTTLGLTKKKKKEKEKTHVQVYRRVGSDQDPAKQQQPLLRCGTKTWGGLAQDLRMCTVIIGEVSI
jgi:hypothetical protein